jgi:WD40 repeat protein/tetratricopeptide (TPR) repeat protein
MILNRSGNPALSPDGKIIVTGINPENGKPAMVQRWEAATGQPIGTPLPHAASVTSVAFTPDGKQFVTGCRDGTVRLWDTATGKFIGERFRQVQVIVSGVDVSPDGRTLAVATNIETRLDRQGYGYLVDLASGKPISPPLRHKGALLSVVFAPTGKTVLSASLDGIAQLWEAVTGLPVGLPLRHPHGVLTARYSPDGRSILTGCRDGVVRTWDAATGSELAGAHLVNKHGVQHLAISPDGAMLLAATGWEYTSGTIQLCRRPQSLSRTATKTRDASVRASWIARDATSFFSRQLVSYSPDARYVLTGGHDGFANLNDAATGQPAYLRGPSVAPFRHAWKRVAVIAFSPDGRCFATASIDSAARGDAHLWSAATGMPIGAPLPQINYVAAMAFSPDGKILATGGYDCMVRLWNTATGAQIGPNLPQRDIVLTLALSPDCRTLAVGHAADYSGSTGTVLLDVETRKFIGTPLQGPFMTICFSPDGRRVLTATESTLRLLDAASGEPSGPALHEPAAVNQAVFRQDGRMILLGCADGTVRLRDPSTGKTIGAPMLHPYQAQTVAFSPDREGKLILAGYADGSARLWDRATQKPLGPPVLQSLPIIGVAFGPDGRSFLTTSTDGNTRRWPVPLAAEESVEQLALRLQVRAALEMGEGQTVVKLAPADWQRRRELLNAQISDSDVARSGDRATSEVGDRATSEMRDRAASEVSDRARSESDAYHEARARDAEQDGDCFAAKWHLDRLIAGQDGKGNASRWILYARRARCLMVEGDRFAEAEADYDRALKHASRQELSNWYRHCMADCLAAKHWPAALWYLDQVIAAEPNDWRLFADRAFVLEKLDRKKERESDLIQATQLGADSNFLIRLAEEYAQHGAWTKSAAAIALARERGQTTIEITHAHSLLCLKTGDQHAYREVCTRFLDAAESTPPANRANSLAWLCAIGPDAVADYAQPIALAELAVANALPGAKSGVLNTLGAILYRAGRHRDAVARLHEGIRARNGEAGVHDWIFLAMAHHRLGEIGESRKSLAKAEQFPLDKQAFSWDRLEIEVLRSEAIRLIAGKPDGRKN